MKEYTLRSLFLTVFLFFASSSWLQAEDMLMARIPMSFPEAMLKLQSVLKKQGLTLSRVQRVDIGLTQSGYETDKYRIVFFGRKNDIKKLSKQHPELIPYLPHKVAIFAEKEETLLVSANPVNLFPEPSPDLEATLQRWQKDLHRIFKAMREEGTDDS